MPYAREVGFTSLLALLPIGLLCSSPIVTPACLGLKRYEIWGCQLDLAKGAEDKASDKITLHLIGGIHLGLWGGGRHRPHHHHRADPVPHPSMSIPKEEAAGRTGRWTSL